MRIGSDARHAPWPAAMSAAEQVDEAARRGLEGLFFRTMLDMSPTLDAGELREIRARADAQPETPEVRAIGDGDTLLGFLHLLAPIARDLDVHLNAETHEEITSFELLRLIESVGADVMGITYDTGNPLQRAEHPRLVAERVAPYVRQTHLNDVALCFDRDGIRGQGRPIGQGVVDMRVVLPPVVAANPDLHLSVETAEPSGGSAPGPRRPTSIALYDPVWVAGHPDRTVDEAWGWVDQSVATPRAVLAEIESRQLQGEVHEA